MKKIISLMAVLFYVLLSFSCEDDISYATVTVYNQSDYVVTGLHAYQEDEENVVLEQGEVRTFNVWAFYPFPYSVAYYINGKYFTHEHMEGVLWQEPIEQPGVIYITSDDDDTVMFYYPEQPDRIYIRSKDSDKGEGYYYSPFLIKNGAKAYVYIDNEGYKLEIEGGEYRVSEFGGLK